MKKYIIPILMVLVCASACVEPDDETKEQQASITGQETEQNGGPPPETHCYENPDGEVFCEEVDPNDPDGHTGDYDPESEDTSYCYLDDPNDPDSEFTCGPRQVDPNDPDGQASDEDPEGANLSGCTNPDASQC